MTLHGAALCWPAHRPGLHACRMLPAHSRTCAEKPAVLCCSVLPCSANMTSKTVQNTTWELPLSMPCDIVGKDSTRTNIMETCLHTLALLYNPARLPAKPCCHCAAPQVT